MATIGNRNATALIHQLVTNVATALVTVELEIVHI